MPKRTCLASIRHNYFIGGWEAALRVGRRALGSVPVRKKGCSRIAAALKGAATHEAWMGM